MSPRIKRILKRSAIGGAIVAGVLLVANGVAAWQSQHRLNEKISALKEAHEPASLAELTPKPIPPDANAAVWLDKTWKDLPDFDAKSQALQKMPPDGWWEQAKQLGNVPNRDQLTALRAIVANYPATLADLERAAKCKEYASLADFSLPPSQFRENLEVVDKLTHIKSIARFVAFNMQLALADENANRATELGIQMLRVLRLYDGRPMVSSFLISTVARDMMFEVLNQVMRSDTIKPEIRRALDEELALQDSALPLKDALRRERAFAVSEIIECSDAIPGYVRWPALNFMVGNLDALDRGYEASKLSLDEVRPKWDAAAKRLLPAAPLPEMKQNQGVAMMISVAFNSNLERLALNRCLRVLNALGEYRQRNGKEAESVEQLKLPKEATIDPWSGKPLLLKKTDAGWVVYSVGKNGVDDGGDFTDAKDEGLPPLGYSSK